ncbi:MAG: hypothetical protein FJX54_22600 [Alphaproteobacteria bacterium]|nr:hypothetical protein [Alphaproteobacteria bacterium]
MKLSLTFPTLFPGPAHRTIENVRSTLSDIDYEIVVVSPFEVSGERVRWISEEAPRGCGAAHATAFANSTGDVICPLADDAQFRAGWVQDGFRTLALNERERPYAVGIGQTNEIVGTVFGIYYPFFPMVRRATLEKVGGFYSPDLKHHFTDSDFAFRILSIGGACGWTDGHYIDRIPRDVTGTGEIALRLNIARNEALAKDTAAFLAKWQSRYGQGWQTDQLHHFNIDVPYILRLMLAEGNTIYQNNPIVARMARNFAINFAAFQERMSKR